MQGGIFSKSQFLNKETVLKSRRLVCSNDWAPQIRHCWKVDVWFEGDVLWHSAGYRLPHMPALLTLTFWMRFLRPSREALLLPEACCTTGAAGPRGSRRRGWMGPSSGKKEGNDRDHPWLLMSTALCESECSPFIRLTTLVPYFNVRCLIYSTNRLAGGRAWKVLEIINLTFQWFFWWDSRWHFSIAFPFDLLLCYLILIIHPLIILPIPIVFLRQSFGPKPLNCSDFK